MGVFCEVETNEIGTEAQAPEPTELDDASAEEAEVETAATES